MDASDALTSALQRLAAGREPPAPESVIADGRRYEVSFVARDQHRVFEAELEAAAGVQLPLSHRAAWREAGLAEGWLLAARREDGSVAAVLPVDLTPTRALPLHRVARADRVGVAAEPEALLALLSAATSAATAAQNVLRFEVGTFSRDAALRSRIGEHLRGLGFVPVAEDDMRSYRHTAAVDLTPAEDALMAGLHKTARRHIRALEKNPVRLGAIHPADAEAVEALVRETRGRTGGHYTARPWTRLIAFAQQHPERMHWVGLFHESNNELIAFASSHHHGDYATYADAGSTRRDDVKLPMGYALVWNLILWARAEGARWFDFGGITEGSHGDGKDPTGGISDFKRYFCGEKVEVAEEWIFEPHPSRARIAGVAREIANGARSLWNRRPH